MLASLEGQSVRGPGWVAVGVRPIDSRNSQAQARRIGQGVGHCPDTRPTGSDPCVPSPPRRSPSSQACVPSPRVFALAQ